MPDKITIELTREQIDGLFGAVLLAVQATRFDPEAKARARELAHILGTAHAEAGGPNEVTMH